MKSPTATLLNFLKLNALYYFLCSIHHQEIQKIVEDKIPEFKGTPMFNNHLICIKEEGIYEYENRYSMGVVCKNKQFSENIFALLEHKEITSPNTFEYLVEKYELHIWSLLSFSTYMQTVVHHIRNTDENIIALYQMQHKFLKMHYDSIREKFTKQKSVNFFKANAFQKPIELPPLTASNPVTKELPEKKLKKKLITEEEAKQELLQKVFGLRVSKE